MTLRTPLGKVLGLGSAKDGTTHWWAQRISAIGLIPLTLWFVISTLTLGSSDHGALIAWAHQPLNAGMLVLLVLVLAYHSELGLQVVVEDYVHAEWLKISTLLVLKFAHVALAAVGLFAILRMALGN